MGTAPLGAGWHWRWNPYFFGARCHSTRVVFFVAVWAIATGVLEILAAIRLRKEIKGEWWLIICGLMSVVFGFLLMVRREQARSPCYG